MHNLIRCLLTCPAAFAALLSAETTLAEDARPKAELRLEVQPADIILDMAAAPVGRLLVLVHNPSGAEVTAKLDFNGPPGLVTKEVQSPSLPASGDLSWLLEVTATESVPSPAKLVIQLMYSVGTGSVPTFAATVATITLPPPQSLVANIKTSLAPSEGNVDEFNPFYLRLQIDNPTRRTVEIEKIEVLAPSPKYIDLTPEQHATTIPPGGSIGVPLTVTAKAAIPGTYTLMVGFNIRFLNPQGAWEPMTAQSKVTIGIPGIADALQFLGIPSLLLLPGVLMILTFLTVLPWLTRLPQVDWKKPALLLLAVILSFAAAYAYPVATQRLGLARDYLRGYELRDVVYVWAGSMVIGLVAAAICTILYWSVVGIRWLNANRNEPQLGDQPIDILKKLRRHGGAFKMRARRQANNAHAPQMLVLPFGQAAEGRQWLIPQALITHTDLPSAEARGTLVQGHLERIDVHTPGAIDLLIQEIEAGLSREELTLKWNPDVGPTLVNTAEYTEAHGSPVMVVRYEP